MRNELCERNSPFLSASSGERCCSAVSMLGFVSSGVHQTLRRRSAASALTPASALKLTPAHTPAQRRGVLGTAAVRKAEAVCGREALGTPSRSTLRRRADRLVMGAAATSGGDRVAKDGDTVLVHYVGTLESDGSVFDESRPRGAPLEFAIASGQVIRGFDTAVRGLAVGGTRTVTVPPSDGYGERYDANVVQVAAKDAPKDLSAGDTVRLSNGMTAAVTDVASDGTITIDANHPLAGKTLVFAVELVGFKELTKPAKVAATESFNVATFAGGCFWGVELAFQREPGVLSTTVGYTQGKVAKPTYRQVCSGETGHTEALYVEYDPSQVSYTRLLELFWTRLGDSALTLNRVGNDQGTQYRSGVYFHDDEQRVAAEAMKEKMDVAFGKKTVVELKPASEFWVAEDYHQQYLEKGGQNASKGATDTIRCYG